MNTDSLHVGHQVIELYRWLDELSELAHLLTIADLFALLPVANADYDTRSERNRTVVERAGQLAASRVDEATQEAMASLS